MATPKKQKDSQTLEIAVPKGKSKSLEFAETVVHPQMRNGHLAATLGTQYFTGEIPDVSDTRTIMVEACNKVQNDDLSDQRDILTSQAIALDALFTSLVSRSIANMGEYVDAADRYMRLALKAQTQCRTTIEALDRLARGGEQVVKHVHVDNRGGQAVIADKVQTGG